MKRTAVISLLILSLTACGLLGGDNEKKLPGKIVFSATDATGSSQIFTMTPNGSGLQQKTYKDFDYGPDNKTDFEGTSPDWSPDGKQIAFSSSYKSTTIGPSLWIMNSDGSDLRPLYDPKPEDPHTPFLEGEHPRWSPDGTKIAFDLCLNCQLSTSSAIFVFDIKTKETTRLTEEPAGYQSIFPVWSPDQRKIAFVSNRDYVNSDIKQYRQELYVMDADGMNQTRLTDTGFPGSFTWLNNEILLLNQTELYSNSKDLLQINLKTNQRTILKEKWEKRDRQIWIYYGGNSEQFMMLNKKYDEISIDISINDLSGNLLDQIHLEHDIFRSSNSFDWYINY